MNDKITSSLAHRSGRENLIYPIQATIGLLDVVQWHDRVQYSSFLNPYEQPAATLQSDLDEWQADRRTQMEKIEDMFHDLLEKYAGTIIPGGDIEVIETRTMKAAIHNDYSTEMPERTYEIGGSKITIPSTVWEHLPNMALDN